MLRCQHIIHLVKTLLPVHEKGCRIEQRNNLYNTIAPLLPLVPCLDVFIISTSELFLPLFCYGLAVLNESAVDG